MSTLYVTGIGPGSDAFLTNEARTVIEQADVICGYTLYVDLLRSRYLDKEFITTPMRQEIERCRMAMEAASSGRTVAMVCSGDAGIYGMAGPLLEMNGRYPDVDTEPSGKSLCDPHGDEARRHCLRMGPQYRQGRAGI